MRGQYGPLISGGGGLGGAASGVGCLCWSYSHGCSLRLLIGAPVSAVACEGLCAGWAYVLSISPEVSALCVCLQQPRREIPWVSKSTGFVSF